MMAPAVVLMRGLGFTSRPLSVSSVLPVSSCTWMSFHVFAWSTMPGCLMVCVIAFVAAVRSARPVMARAVVPIKLRTVWMDGRMVMQGGVVMGM